MKALFVLLGLALIAFGIADIFEGWTANWLPTVYQISPTMSITGEEVIFIAAGIALIAFGAL